MPARCRIDLGLADLSGVGDKGAGKDQRGFGLGVRRTALTVGQHFISAEACLATDRGMRRNAILAGILFGNRQGNPLAGLRVQRTRACDAALEDRLGAQVFNRTTRSLAITEVGQRFLENARRILTDLDMAEREAVGETAIPHGHLTITASVTFGRLVLAPRICSFLNQYPQVTVSVLMVDRVVSLVEEGIDVAVRIGPLPDSSLAAKRIGSVRRLLVASPDYLDRKGPPTSPTDLKLHAVIAVTGLMPNREWRLGCALR